MAPKALALIVARELASNLATPIFLIDAAGTLVFYNESAEAFLGRPFAELGEISVLEFGAMLDLRAPDGEPLARRDTPTSLAFNERHPAHAAVLSRSLDGSDHLIEATALPLFGSTDDLHGVMTIFWEPS